MGKRLNDAVQMIVALVSNFVGNSAALNMHEELFDWQSLVLSCTRACPSAMQSLMLMEIVKLYLLWSEGIYEIAQASLKLETEHHFLFLL